MPVSLRVAAVIPARYQSSRFPGKPLADLGGKSLIQRTYEAVLTSEVASSVFVATDDERIHHHVRDFGGQSMLTQSDHPSGTDRVNEVAQQLPDHDVILNVQGDEPFTTAAKLRTLVKLFADPDVNIATLARPIDTEEELFSPNVVKLTRATNGDALYFSRQAIPFLRDQPLGRWLAAGVHLQHLGIYAFRRATLLQVATLPPGRLEALESLEQLRWLEAGYRIRVGLTNEPSIGIDTPADLDRARTLLQ